MIGWALMILDLASLGVISLNHFGYNLSWGIILYAGSYLMGKGVMFKDTMSIIDLVCGFYLILTFALGINSIIYYFILGWFMYKLSFTIINF